MLMYMNDRINRKNLDIQWVLLVVSSIRRKTEEVVRIRIGRLEIIVRDKLCIPSLNHDSKFFTVVDHTIFEAFSSWGSVDQNDCYARWVPVSDPTLPVPTCCHGVLWHNKFDPLSPPSESIFVSGVCLTLSSLPMSLGVANSWLGDGRLVKTVKIMFIWLFCYSAMWNFPIPLRVCIDLTINCLNLSETTGKLTGKKSNWLTPEYNAIVCKRKWQAWGWSCPFADIYQASKSINLFMCMLF